MGNIYVANITLAIIMYHKCRQKSTILMLGLWVGVMGLGLQVIMVSIIPLFCKVCHVQQQAGVGGTLQDQLTKPPQKCHWLSCPNRISLPLMYNSKLPIGTAVL